MEWKSDWHFHSYYLLLFFFFSFRFISFAFLLKNFIVIPVRTQSQPFGLNNSFWGLFSKGKTSSIQLGSFGHLNLFDVVQVEISIIHFLINDIYDLINLIILNVVKLKICEEFYNKTKNCIKYFGKFVFIFMLFY